MCVLELIIVTIYHKTWNKRRLLMRDDIKEYNVVENLGKKFCEAVKKGDSSIIRPHFYEKACFFGQLNETTYQSGSIQ